VLERQAAHLSLAPTPADQGSGAAQPVSPAQPIGAAQPVDLPPERRPPWSTLVMLAVAIGLAAVLLGALAVIWPNQSSSPAPTNRSLALEAAVSIIADPAGERIPFAGSLGRLVLLVGRQGDAVLTLNGLGSAPEGRAYQAWVTQPGPGETLPAGLFSGSERFVPLTKQVAPGAQVSITLEDEGGASAPSRAPRLVAVRPASAPRS
jgi:Anti-sigma-K factor rskA